MRRAAFAQRTKSREAAEAAATDAGTRARAHADSRCSSLRAACCRVISSSAPPVFTSCCTKRSPATAPSSRRETNARASANATSCSTCSASQERTTPLASSARRGGGRREPSTIGRRHRSRTRHRETRSVLRALGRVHRRRSDERGCGDQAGAGAALESERTHRRRFIRSPGDWDEHRARSGDARDCSRSATDERRRMRSPSSCRSSRTSRTVVSFYGKLRCRAWTRTRSRN